MAKYNLTLLVIAIIGLVIVISGCTGGQDVKINTGDQGTSNVSTTTSNPIEIPTPGKQTEILNVDRKKIVLSDNEIREFIGNEWNLTEPYGIMMYQKQSTIYNKPDIFFIYMVIFPNITAAKETYSKTLTDGLNGKWKNPTIVDINLGDSARYITTKQDMNNRDTYDVLFLRSNILVMMETNSKPDIDNLTSLAKKQDEKILGILKMIQ